MTDHGFNPTFLEGINKIADFALDWENKTNEFAPQKRTVREHLQDDFAHHPMQMEAILNLKPLPASEFVELYTTIYKRATTNSNDSQEEHNQEILFKAYEGFILDMISRFGNILDFAGMLKAWFVYKVYVFNIIKVFSYLGRKWVRGPDQISLFHTALNHFLTHVFRPSISIFNDHFPSLVKELARCEHFELLSSYADMFVNMETATEASPEENFYMTYLATPYGEFVQEKLHLESQSWGAGETELAIIPAFLRKASDAINLEKMKVDNHLRPSSWVHLNKELVETLLISRTDELLQASQSFYSMLDNDDHESLGLIPALFGSIDASGVDKWAYTMRLYLESQIQTIFKDPGDSSLDQAAQEGEFMRKMVKLHDKYNCIVTTGPFRELLVFLKAVKDAFSNLLNQPNNAVNFVDIFLRILNSTLSAAVHESEGSTCEGFIRSLMDLFIHLAEKEAFMTSFRGFLAERLLGGLGYSASHEGLILSILKKLCGASYTSKGQGMLKDMDGDTNHGENIVARLKETSFHLRILNKAYWPEFKDIQCERPIPEMQRIAGHYEDYHKQANQHSQLEFLNNRGFCVINATLNGIDYKLHTTVLQAQILLTLDQKFEMSYASILEERGLPDHKSVRSTIHALVDSGVLICSVSSMNGRDYAMETTFTVNQDFATVLAQGNLVTTADGIVTLQRPMETEQSAAGPKKTELAVACVDAAIMKILKKAKTLAKPDLIQQISQLTTLFEADNPIVDERLGTLIQRNFVSSADGYTYNYEP